MLSMGKSTISMAIFNSKLLVITREGNPLATQRHSSQLMADRVPQSNHPGSPGGCVHWALDLISRAGNC